MVDFWAMSAFDHAVPTRMTHSSFDLWQAAAFRLERHHLGHTATATSIADLCRDTVGVQAQLMSAAEIALWTRNHALTRHQIQAALLERRDIVRTSAMRVTLHLIATTDFPIVIAALKASSMAQRWRTLSRIGVTADDVEAMNAILLETLADASGTQQDLVSRVRAKAGPRMRIWLEHAWSAVRPAVIDGLICYGPPRGSEVTFVRVDKWLGRQARVDPPAARAELLRRFLAAFGPATRRDFAKWSGLSAADAISTWASLGEEIADVRVDGASGSLLRRDLKALAAAELDREDVRLLGAFDPLLLAHATKAHLVDARHYKRVYRAQGWISPVVLAGGRVAGVWTSKVRGKTMALEVELFGRVSRAVRTAIEAEAEALGRFLGARCEVRVA